MEEFVFMDQLIVETRREAEKVDSEIHPKRRTGSIPRPESLLEKTKGSIFRNVTWDIFYTLSSFLHKALRERGYLTEEHLFGLAFRKKKFFLLIRRKDAANVLGLSTETELEASKPELIIPEVREKISKSQSQLKH